MFNAILVAMLIVPILVQNAQGFTWPGTDEPVNTGGDGFVSGDPCGFVYAIADNYPSMAALTATVNFGAVTDTDQGCVDENGYFYSSSSRESYARYTRTGYSTTYTLDFDYNTTSNVFVDPLTGEWSGAARITNGTIPLAQRWVDFDWDCTDSCALDPADYHVYTDMTTGAVSGYAWSDYFNDYISFNGLTQELPARDIVTYVDILANETTDGPDDVDYTDAPLADGAEFWRVRVQFLDTTTGEFLTADDITTLAITITDTSDSNVYFNQVTNEGDAIEVSYYNPMVGCTSSSVYCTMTEDDGSVSFNKFVFSGSPTSNVLGDNDDTDLGLEYPSDRDGCKWIYPEQGSGTCTPTSYDKSEVFYDRSNSRNKYEIDYVTLQVNFAGDREVSMYTYPTGWTSDDGSTAYVEADDGVWRYYPGEDVADLSFRPRYQIGKFVAVFDGVENTSISEDTTKTMYLKTEATMLDSSDAFLARSGSLKPRYHVYYQMDATSDAALAASDTKLLIDTDSPPSGPSSGDVEETKRTDSITAPTSPATAYNSYSKNYAIGYGQKASYLSTCGVAVACTTPTNTLTDPTAEQWVCDEATETTLFEISCYYTAYLEHIDRHDEAQSMLVIGAINSVIDADDVLSEISEDNGTVLSVQGSIETINHRNLMYAQGLRYALGNIGTATAGGSFSTSGVASSGLVELLNGRLYYTEGDVIINGFDGTPKTLFVNGGDVFVNTDITNGQIGIIAFKRDGSGGNVYVDNEVTNLAANLFLDGSLFSYNGTAPSGTVPTYSSDELRLETLMHQLHLKGSLVSRNTVNGSVDSDGDGIYDLGDGTTTTDFDTAREYDLNMLRQFRLCHPVVDGVPDETLTEECEEGEQLSTYGEDNGYYNSFILEYDPADELPIFQVEYGLFN